MEVKPFKLIIAGSRDFDDYNKLKTWCDFLLTNKQEIEIVSGGQKTWIAKEKKYIGADYLGEQYAKERGYPIKQFLPDWDTHGKAAGPIRNKQMADYADGLIAFWKNRSKGTKNMIDQAGKAGLKIRVCFT